MANILIGLFLLGSGVLLIVGIIGVSQDNDTLVYGAFGAFFVGVAVFFIAIALLVIFVGFSPNPLVEGQCYRAVRHTTTNLIPVGKVLVPSTTSGIDLEEVRCP